MKRLARLGFVTAVVAAACSSVWADINVGVVVSTTGPAASLGIPEKNTIALLPTTMGGQKINYIILDDASDTTAAVANTRKLISESKADVIIGSSTTPNSLAMIDVVAESKTPMMTLGASARIISPMDAKKAWVFKTPQNDAMMAGAIVDHMVKAGIKTAAYIGFNDAYGEGWLQEFKKSTEAKGIKLVATEAFSRSDTSVTGQALKIMAAKPDAVLVGGSGTPAALPEKTLKERGFKGKYYQTHGVANADFLRVGGKDVEGTMLPAGPVLVAHQLPDSHPVKKSAVAYVDSYEAKYGKGTAATFGGHVWDAGQVLAAAVPEALKKAQPGTEAFRVALRDALENVRDIAGSHGVFTMTPTDHLGIQHGVVMVKIENGGWKFTP
ncbi:ABC transporter substrate-binding protein [Diaphorobacter sp. HDW4B]|uniref:ABC transporter substrate-binding protein n=1 Tax=Diaphorobacter sp. HDW4B TaxID=2714925 RepID=UPI00140DB5E2|nr:ABC transporter substrate-binding protein [Diaphorobacter sp. HDW4B]QIL70714.1 ABC transporter substrate-binding protein [Diaphorobacter sp. HDW4B]